MPVPRIIKNLLRVLNAEEIFRVVAVGFGTIKELNFDTNCANQREFKYAECVLLKKSDSVLIRRN
jgi:hypothetical protein